MCHLSCIIFGAVNIREDEIRDKTVLDVGSYDHNGNFNSLLKHYHPKKYVGVDMFPGPGVDIVCKGEEILEKFGENSFDIVVSSELMEHARNWKTIISNIKHVCKPGGLVVITTRSFGFGLHGYPYDYWRYETEDMKEIFSDFEILTLEKDTQAPGVFIKARKPVGQFIEKDLTNIALYSIIEHKRTPVIDEKLERAFIKKYNFRKKVVSIKGGVFKGIEELGRKVFGQ